MAKQNRIDAYLVINGFTSGRERAKEIIKAGYVTLDGIICTKPSADVTGKTVEVSAPAPKFVSRGGDKLEKAVSEFKINITEKVCMDIGASTGGFTDCMLSHGAIKVFSIDVGHGQLHSNLLSDGRVINIENTNIRYVNADDFPKLGFISCDVSFISLRLVLPKIKELLSQDGKAVCLVKPQFEVGRTKIKNGVVKSPLLHLTALSEVYDFAVSLGFCVTGLGVSPVMGSDGNIEYLMLIEKNGLSIPREEIKKAVALSHDT